MGDRSADPAGRPDDGDPEGARPDPSQRRTGLDSGNAPGSAADSRKPLRAMTRRHERKPDPFNGMRPAGMGQVSMAWRQQAKRYRHGPCPSGTPLGKIS